MKKLSKLQERRLKEIDEYTETSEAKKAIEDSFRRTRMSTNRLGGNKRSVCSECDRPLPCQCLIMATA